VKPARVGKAGFGFRLRLGQPPLLGPAKERGYYDHKNFKCPGADAWLGTLHS
jgi:hypothetical protein